MPRWVRRTAVLLAGTMLLTLGIALIVLPGPAVLVIPAALGLLATEFEWAQRWRAQAEAGWLRIRDGLGLKGGNQEEERRRM
ncbi:PGPGW domain-containing protein [Myxococcota bacterium]|nr:PGPGW domain-containing protein [Myxococcota bacterium]